MIMKKYLSLTALLCAIFIFAKAQNPFFEVVNYRGAFAPAPATMWTDGWTNWAPQSTNYPTPTVTVTGNITANTTWTASNTYLISGLVYVNAGATLTIQPGTVIRGDATVANSSLVITKGGKINAVGTPTNPIVFTSSKDTGMRNIGDWGGIIILGKSTVNKTGGIGNIEGIAVSSQTEYGGGTSPDDNDNSGNLKYVRIEYGGYVFATDQEINGLTMGAVGRNTVIDFVQCSFINDDAFEWFGGTVNCSHLVAYRCLDDNFDTDNGFSGSVQFCLGVRDPNISDQSASSTSEGFESDNDAAGSSNTPQTTAVFSNITDISGFRGTPLTSWPSTFKFRRGARIRRNSGIKILNSIMMDAPYGVFIDGAACRANLGSGVTVFKNNIIAGSYLAAEPGTASTLRDSLFSGTIFKNDSLTSTSGLLTNPYDFSNPDYRPSSGGLAVTKTADFTDAAFNKRKIIVTSASSIREVTYRGAFAPAPAVMWTDGWTNWNPNATFYPTPTVTITGNITTNTTWSASNTYLISGLVYVNAGVTLTIEQGTIVRGDATVPNSSLIISKGGTLNAIGTAQQPIVFTSSKDSGTRNIGDWGGVILLGRASYNGVGGVGNIEGIAVSTQTEFGGGASPNDNDNSGTLKYIRIEFGGYIFATDKEINGLTMGAVGRGTTIDYVQCSFVNDDAFEWFGGTVNCSHLVAYRCLDDDFDTDNGFSGSVQFCLGVRDPNISDQSSSSTSEGFESDNDAAGSTNTPQTKALFTNITEIGPFRGTVLTSWGTTFKFRRAARIRRNSGLRVFNSILMDYPYGVFMDGALVRANLQTGITKFKNNLVAGCRFSTEPGTLSTITDSLFQTGTGYFKNDSLASTANVLASPYDFLNPDYRPGSSPLVTTGAAFTDSAFNGLMVPCDEVSAPGSVTGSRIIQSCTNPQTYSTAGSSNASSYSWTVPTGATIVSGQGTKTISVSFSSSVTSGVISVVGKNDCGNTSLPATISVASDTVRVPADISGAKNISGCTNPQTYSTAGSSNASTYTWTVPTGASIVSGQGTTTITVNFPTTFTTGTISVVGQNNCGRTSLPSSISLSKVVLGTPTAISSNPVRSNVCTMVGTDSTIKYYITKTAGATEFRWTLPANTTLVSGGGLADTSATIKFNSGYTTALAGDTIRVTVYASACQVTKQVKLAIKASLPTAPASITIQAKQINVCGVRLYRYVAPALPAGTSGYEWSFSGSLAATASVDSGGLNQQVVVMKFTSNAASATGDSVRLRYIANCGYSPYKSAKLTNTLLSTPAAPATITITKLADKACGQPKFRYAASALVAASTTAGAATGWDWTIIGYLGGRFVVDSGSLTSQVFTAYFTDTASAKTGDSVKCRYNSDCGYGIYKASKLTNTTTGILAPLAPASVTITLVWDSCGNRVYRYTAPVLPAGTTVYSAPTGYNWMMPFGTVGSTGTLDSGSLTGRVIRIKYSSNAAAGTGDSIKVQYTSLCNSSLYKAQKLSNLARTCPRPAPATSSVANSEATIKMEATIFPNPNKGSFTLVVNNTGINAREKAVIHIFDMTGRVVAEINAINENGLIYSPLNNINVQPGTYIVRYHVGSHAGSVRMAVIK